MSSSVADFLTILLRPNWTPYKSQISGFDFGLWYSVTSQSAALFLPTVDFSDDPNSNEIGYVLKVDGSNLSRTADNASITGKVSRLSLYAIDATNAFNSLLGTPTASVELKDGTEYSSFEKALLADLTDKDQLQRTNTIASFLKANTLAEQNPGDPENLPNQAPVAIVVGNLFPSSDQGRPQQISSLIKVQDANYDTPTQYEFKITKGTSQSGYFIFNGIEFRNQDLKSVAAKDLNRVFFVPGPAGAPTTISFRAYDGQAWSEWAKPETWSTAANNKPVVKNDSQSFQDTQAGRAIQASTLFSVSDIDNDPITRYDFKTDSTSKDSGYFLYRKKRYQGRELNGISAQALKDVIYVPGTPGTSNLVSIRASDGKEDSNWASSKWSTKASQAPSLSISRYQPPSSLTQGIGISNLIAVNNPGLTPLAAYSLINKGSSTGGYFQFKGEIFKGQELIVKPQDLAKVSYVPGSPGDKDKIEVKTLSASGSTLANAQANWTVPKINSQIERHFNLSIDRRFELGDYLNVPNSKEFKLFIGPDIKIANQSFNPKVSIAGGEVGVRASTGNIELKAGLDLTAGYDLGSLHLRGGAQASVSYNPSRGLTFTGAVIAPQIDISIPSGYLKLDAVAKAIFNPRLNGYYRDIPLFGSGSQNVSLPTLNVNKKTNLVDFNTQRLTGSSLTRSFNFGGFQSSLRLPNFAIPSELNRIPSAFNSDATWRSGFGAGKSYGYSGESTLLDFSLSLAPIATYLGLPISFSQSILGGAASVEAKLLDLGLSAKSTLSYSANAAIKPNAYVEIEGSNRRFELSNNLNINPSNFRDTNNDNKIKVTLSIDPIIGINALARIQSNVSGFFKALEASAKVDTAFLQRQINVGPAINRSFSLGDLGTRTLFDETSVFALSEVFPRLQSALTKSFDIPI